MEWIFSDATALAFYEKRNLSKTFPQERCFYNEKINYKLIKDIPIIPYCSVLPFAEVTEGKVPEGLKATSRL